MFCFAYGFLLACVMLGAATLLIILSVGHSRTSARKGEKEEHYAPR